MLQCNWSHATKAIHRAPACVQFGRGNCSGVDNLVYRHMHTARAANERKSTRSYERHSVKQPRRSAHMIFLLNAS